MPEHRRHNKFCASNRYNRILRHKTMKEIFHLILQIRNTKQGHAELANLICPDGRWYRWNFQHMEKQNPHIQTIEFRQPPGSTASRGATFWPQFTISFVAGVVVDRRKHDPDIPATLAGLYNLVSSGASYVGMEDKDQLTQFFKDREQLQEEMYPEQTWTAEDGALVLARRGKEVVRERKKQAALEEQVALQELQGINLSDDETDENELWRYGRKAKWNCRILRQQRHLGKALNFKYESESRSAKATMLALTQASVAKELLKGKLRSAI